MIKSGVLHPWWIYSTTKLPHMVGKNMSKLYIVRGIVLWVLITKKNSLDNVGGELYDKMSFLRSSQEKKLHHLRKAGNMSAHKDSLWAFIRTIWVVTRWKIILVSQGCPRVDSQVICYDSNILLKYHRCPVGLHMMAAVFYKRDGPGRYTISHYNSGQVFQCLCFS